MVIKPAPQATYHLVKSVRNVCGHLRDSLKKLEVLVDRCHKMPIQRRQSVLVKNAFAKRLQESGVTIDLLIHRMKQILQLHCRFVLYCWHNAGPFIRKERS